MIAAGLLALSLVLTGWTDAAVADGWPWTDAEICHAAPANPAPGSPDHQSCHDLPCCWLCPAGTLAMLGPTPVGLATGPRKPVQPGGLTNSGPSPIPAERTAWPRAPPAADPA